MIALLSCFTSSYANNDCFLLRGSNDSTLISYNDLRLVNSKLIELEYTKQINDKYKELHKTDSTSIVVLNNNIKNVSNKVRKVTKERNIAINVGGVSIILLILSLFK